MDIDLELDALGMLCPLPVLKARKRLKAMHPGQVLKLVANDPAAVIDVPHFCQEQGYELLKVEQAPGQIRHYFIKVAGPKGA